MAHFTVHQLTTVILLAVASSAKDQSRWSRQISSYTADISDWVPLSGPVEREPPLPPIKRQAVAEPRILTEPFPGSRPNGFDAFPSRSYYNAPSNRQLYLQSVPSVPSAPQNFLTDTGFGHSIRFGLQQPNFPLSQGFVSPSFGYENTPQLKSRPSQMPAKYDNFQKPPQLPVVPPKAFNSQPKKPEAPKFVDGYRAENSSNEYYKKKPQSLQKIKFESYEKKPEQQSSPKVEREEVQLLYVPLESLNRGQFNFRSPITNSQITNMDLYSQGVPKLQPELQRPVPKPVDTFSGHNYFSDFNSQLKDLDQVPKFSTLSSPFPTAPPTTPKPKKLKPHQPPLAIFLTEEASRNRQIKVGDVLNSLKHATSVPVLDSVNPLNAPKVFIGPSSLHPPERYVKFELPYLSNIENTDKKLRQLPFFVAPLSYNTPQGFAKIPFPSPHVGSVVINSQIRDTTTQLPSTENLQPNYYTGLVIEQKPATQKPSISFYTTSAPNVDIRPNYQSNYYSFEPQSVSTLRPFTEPEVTTKPGNYFLNNGNTEAQYNFAPQNSYPVSEPIKPYVAPNKIVPTTTTTTTTKPPSTYPSQLLETHNPYSINQAFHFSTPLDHPTYFEEYKPQQAVATPGSSESPVVGNLTPVPPKPSTTTAKVEEVVTERQTYHHQISPNYVQSYSPEIHYEREVQSPRYPGYNTNEYTTRQESAETYSPVKENIAEVSPPQYHENQEIQAPEVNENITEDKRVTTAFEDDSHRYEYNQYESSNDEYKTSTTSTSTTTRRPIRTRGRPRYTTTPRSAESSEYSTRAAATRRPLRERRPLPTRREPNKITTEKPTRKPIDYSSESTTKSIRTRTRGRIQYRPNESDEQDKVKQNSKKDQDLAYQRDVLHQNYPVTIQERMSTVDIEAITEPSPKIPSTKSVEYATENYDTEHAYTNEKAHSVSPFSLESESDSKEDIPVFNSRTTVAQTESSYIPRLSSHNEEYEYHVKSTVAPTESASYEEAVTEKDEDNYAKQTIRQKEEPVYTTESITLSEQNSPNYSINSEYSSRDETTTPEVEATTVASAEEEENVVQTTPSYNRVRVRPGVIRQYHQVSTESPRIKTDRRRPVTYRPAFDKRRTTMRIDEIEADLKTKQVHGRYEHEYKHPVYKPEPSTEATSTQEVSTKRGVFRRRRPSNTYTTSTTEGSASRNKYEVKNRFRGRRPTTEKPTEKPDIQTDASTSIRPLYTRHSPRPRLSERYHKKPEPETEDQEPNYSYNRPKYIEPESDNIWSSKISTDSFKPYNPNDIADEEKISTTERRSDKGELDIITARNEYEDILISVTPATNNRDRKKIPDIPPTLEALVEQSKVTKSESGDGMSTFENMLEEVMKSLEEQDEDEYSSNVMKHKGGEIGEIPPERIITSGDVFTQKTTPVQQETTTVEPTTDDATQSNEEESDRKKHRRGFWKKVKVRPVTESIEASESQYYHTTVNRFGQPLRQSHEKTNYEKPRVGVTTYKPTLQFKNIFSSEDEEAMHVESMEIAKLTTDKDEPTTVTYEEHTEKYASPGEVDLGTGSPAPTIDSYITEATTTVDNKNKADRFTFMDYLFGITSEDDIDIPKNETKATEADIEITTEAKPKMITTESSYIPEEITEAETVVPEVESSTTDAESVNTKAESVITAENLERVETSVATEAPKVETTKSAFMNINAISTSMSTEVSHETEICFRGKCIKTSKDIL